MKKKQLTTILKSIVAFLFFLSFTLSSQAQYYWVGGSGNWSDYQNHWATSSGGNAFHASPPSSSDDVYFDSNSFANNGEGIIIDATAYCHTMDWSMATNFPFIQGETQDTLKVYGSFLLTTDMTYNVKRLDLWTSENNAIINTQNIEMGLLSQINLRGSGTWDLASNLSCADLYLHQGTFNTNGYDINLTSSFRVYGSGYKYFNAFNSTISATIWIVSGQNFNTDMGTSTLIARQFEPGYVNGQYYDLHLYHNAHVSQPFQAHLIDFSATTGWSCTLHVGITITCDEFVGNGTRLIPLELKSDTPGQEATINKTSGSVDLEYVNLTDIHATGGAIFNAVNGIDNGNNVGWNITEPQPMDFYWVGDGGNWSDVNHWATTSGGSTLHEIFPTKYDNVFIDENSFSQEDQTIEIDTTCMTRNFTTEGVLFAPTFYVPYQNQLNIYGNCFFSDNVTKSIWELRMIGAEYDVEYHCGTLGTISYLRFGNGVHCNLTQNLSCSHLNINAEVYFNSNDYDINCSTTLSVSHYPETTTQAIFGTSEIHCQNFMVSSNTILLEAQDATIHCSEDFKGHEHNFGHVILEGEGTILTNNTFNTLEFLPGANYQIEVGTVQTINNELLLEGTPTDPINITTTETGQQATFSKSSGTVEANYISLQDNVATGGATFNATQSIDNGNNVGWNITEIQPQDYYWVGGTGNWSDAQNHWATTSGGNTFHNYVPGALDNVYFDANSFTENAQTVTMDLSVANFHNMDWSGVNYAVNFEGDNTSSLNVYGAFILDDDMTINIANIHFLATDTVQLFPGSGAAPGSLQTITFEGSGTWNLQDSLSATNVFFYEGTLNSNDYGINISNHLEFSTANNKTLNLGTSTIYTYVVKWEDPFGSNLFLEAGETHWFIEKKFTPLSNEANNTYNINTVTFVESNDEGMIGFNNQLIDTLTIAAGRTIRLVQNVSFSVNQLIVEGTADSPITLFSNQEGSQSTILQENGEVNGQYLILQDIAGLGGATFYANNSIDNGNNSGWIFTGIAQTIDFPPLEDVMENTAPFDLAATSSSGLEVIYTVLGGPATIEGNTLTILGAGQIEIQASQPGDLEYNPAPSITRSFCAIPLQPTITGTYLSDSAELESSAPNGNQWYVDGNLIDGATGQIYNTTQDGLYTVIVDVNGCVSEESEGYQLTGVSVDELGFENIAMYPNPATNNQPIYLQGLPHDANVQCIDMAGRTIRNISARDHWVLSGLNSGIYLIKITTDRLSRTLTLVIR